MKVSGQIIITVFILFTAGQLVAAERSFLFQPAGSNFLVYNRAGKNFYIHQNKLMRWNLMGSYRKLASGKRINISADDPSGLAVLEKMNSIVAEMKQQSMNLQDYRNYIRYYDGVLAQNMNALKRIRELILRSSSGILGPDDRAINQSEIDQYLSQINMNARFSMFNKRQVIPQLTVKGMNLEKVDVVRNLYGSMKLVDDALSRLMKMRGRAGAQENVYTMRIKGKLIHMVNLQQSASRTGDADMAEEISRLMTNSVLYKSNIGVMMRGR